MKADTASRWHHALVLCVFCAGSFVACSLAAGDPCERPYEQGGCPPEAICDELTAPAPDVCRECRVAVEGTRQCRLRCEVDADCEDDQTCVDVVTPEARYNVCLPPSR